MSGGFFKRRQQEKRDQHQSTRTCFGIDYTPSLQECAYNCPDRFACKTRFSSNFSGSLSSARKSSPSPSPNKAVATTRNEASEEDYLEVEPKDNTGVATVYTHNALLGMGEAAADELKYMFGQWPRLKYRFKRKE